MKSIEAFNINDAYEKIKELFSNEDNKFTYENAEFYTIDSILVNIKNNNNKIANICIAQNNIVSTLVEFLVVFSNFGINDKEREELLEIFQPRNYYFDFNYLSVRDGNSIHDFLGENQLFTAYSILKSNINTTRAVIGLYNPDSYINTKQPYAQPCQHYWYYLFKEDKLCLNVVLRSLSFEKGLLLINYFEWNCFLQMMANWIDVPMGEINIFIGRFSVDNNYLKKSSLLGTEPISKTINFDVKIKDFNNDKYLVDRFLVLIKNKCNNVCLLKKISNQVKSEFLSTCLNLVIVYLLTSEGKNNDAKQIYDELSVNELTSACNDFFRRKWKEDK